MNKILDAREKRANHILQLIKNYKDKTIVIMKANVPGVNKNPKNMGFICRYFSELVDSTFGDKIIDSKKIKSLDGDYMYFIINDSGNIVKEKTILIEEKNHLGRLIDIDVFNETAITREDVECETRKCLICDNYAHLCSRSKEHSESEVFLVINEIIRNFLVDLVLNKTISSIYSELDLYPKFGLVSRHDSGCHTDMDSNTFVESIFAIKPFIKEFILYGINDLDDPLKLQEIGIEAEKAMLRATLNVNTHKGLIFALGVFLPSLTKAILKQEDIGFLKQEIKHISEVVIGDYYKNIATKEHKSHGDEIYLLHNLKGLRGEALNGFNIIFDIPSFKDTPSLLRYHEFLISFMSILDDTTIIHKTNIDTLNEVKSVFSDFVDKGGYTANKEIIIQLSESYKKRNISPGGSADLLVLKIVFEELKYLLCNDNKKTANID
jgi:holo-ACP synthase CitX